MAALALCGAGCTHEGSYLIDGAVWSAVNRPRRAERVQGADDEEHLRRVGDSLVRVRCLRPADGGRPARYEVVVDGPIHDREMELEEAPDPDAAPGPGGCESAPAIDRVAERAERIRRCQLAALDAVRERDGEAVYLRCARIDRRALTLLPNGAARARVRTGDGVAMAGWFAAGGGSLGLALISYFYAQAAAMTCPRAMGFLEPAGPTRRWASTSAGSTSASSAR